MQRVRREEREESIKRTQRLERKGYGRRGTQEGGVKPPLH
jgi:hypothetical protein